MKNVTITLDGETAAWARVYAAQHNLSVSRFVGELLQQRMRESREYDEAIRDCRERSHFAIVQEISHKASFPTAC